MQMKGQARERGRYPCINKENLVTADEGSLFSAACRLNRTNESLCEGKQQAKVRP